MKRELLSSVLDARKSKRPMVIVTAIESGAQALIGSSGDLLCGDGALIDEPIVAAATAALRDDRCSVMDTPAGRIFLQTLNPPLRMIIVGAVHITQALAPMAALMGYEVAVVDPRRAFASENRFPEVRVIVQWPDEALSKLAPDERTAVVTLTHDPKLDDPALRVALGSQAFYIASLGSKRTHAARVARLKDAGFSERQIARIHGPAGLAINARSPAEIATAIMAQATQSLRSEAKA